MPTCTNINELIQAYVDGQLSSEERIYVETHIRDCQKCAIRYAQARDLTAHLVSALAPVRISTTFVDRVTESLPDMEDVSKKDNMRALNKETKREDRWHWWGRLIPYAATVGLAAALALLMSVWPDEPLGYVAKVTNSAQLRRYEPARDGVTQASIGDSVFSGDMITVKEDARIIVTLATAELKLNGGSRLRIVNDREVELVKGELYADVITTGTPFEVKLRSGDITVLGTKFVVQALTNKTVVTVAEGKVFFENRAGYSEVSEGRQSISLAGGTPSVPEPAEVPLVTSWADNFVVTQEDHALARLRGTVLQSNRYARAPGPLGEPVPRIEWYFNSDSLDVPILRYVTINRDAFGSNPNVQPDRKFAIHVCDVAKKPLVHVEASYSIFDGTDSVELLSLPYEVPVDGMFYIIFQPYAASELRTTGEDLPVVYSGVEGLTPTIVVKLATRPATEDVT